MPDLPWFVYAWPLLMIGVVVAAVVYKYLQVRQAAMWPHTTGKVVVSTSERRTVQMFDDDRQGGRGQEVRNFAKIVYEYRVRGQLLRCSRVSIGEDLGNFQVEETIAKYPVGAIVTVYYNPLRPKQAVLERDLPEGMFGCAIWGIGIALVAVYGSFYGFNQLAVHARQFVGNPTHTPVVVGLSAMGVFALLFGLVLLRRGREARGWPKVNARITRSEIDEFRGSLGASSQTTTTLYRPLITYAYEYNGIEYHGDQVSLGARVTANMPVFARRLVAKYPAGRIFEVHVNPQNASEAVLNSKPVGGWLILVVAAALLAGAYFISQQP